MKQHRDLSDYGSRVISRNLLAWVSVAGIILDLFGGLYLAYDLLGGRRGPLRMLARSATYAAVFGVLYTLGLPLPFAPIAGVGLGLLLGFEYGLKQGETVGLGFALLRGVVFGVAGGALYGARFGVVFGVGCAIALAGAYRLRFSVAADYPTKDAPRVRPQVLTAQAVRAGLTAPAAIIAGVAASRPATSTVVFALRLGAVSWLAGSLVGSTTPSVEQWADEVSTRRLGLVGALLIFVGLLFQSVQYWVVILDVRVQ